MSNLKRNIRFLSIIICLSFLPIMSSEFNYIPVPEIPSFTAISVPEISIPDSQSISQKIVEDGTSLVKDFSQGVKEAIRNDSRLIFVPALAVAGALLYGGRNQISAYAQHQCDILEKETAEYLEKGINTNTPAFFCGKTMRMYFWRPLCIGIPNYLSHNKFYITAALICCVMGHIFGHPVLGGGLGGTSLAAGWLNQGHAETQSKLQVVRNAIEASRQENEALHAKAKAERKDIKKRVKALSGQITVQGEAITADIKQVETTMSKKMEIVGEQVKGVETKVAAVGEKLTVQVEEVDKKIAEVGIKVDALDAIPGQIISLLKEVSAVKIQNTESVAKANDLFKRLEETSQAFVATKEAIQKQVEDLVKKTVESNQKIEVTQGLQSEEIHQLLTRTAQQGSSLSVLQNLLEVIQKEQSKHAEDICAKFDAIALKTEVDKQELEMLNAFKLSTSNGITKLTEDLSLLSKAQESMQLSINGFFSTIEARFSEVDSKIEANQREMKETIQSSQATIVQQMQRTREDQEVENKKLKQKIKAMKQQQFDTTNALLRLENTVQQLGAKIVNQNAQTQNLIVQGFTNSAPFVPINQDTEQDRALQQLLSSASKNKYPILARSFSSGTGVVPPDGSQKKFGYLSRKPTNSNLVKKLEDK